MAPLRRLSIVLALAAMLAACQTDVEPVRGEDLLEQAREALDDIRGEQEQPAPEPGAPSEPETDQGQPPPGDAPPGDAEPPAAVQDQRGAVFDERAGLGGMCRAYLRGDVPRLVVEISHQAGAPLAPAAVDHMVGVLRSVVDKPAGVTATSVQIPGGARTWTRADLEAASREHRRNHSGDDQLVMHVLSLQGQFEDPDVLGVAFDASSFAIFPDRLDGVARLLGGSAALERAILVHEAGHLLCLVNITYTSAIDHEHPEHPHHSADEASVMYWAIANSAAAQAFTGPPPADFTANDLADLDGLRTGRY